VQYSIVTCIYVLLSRVSFSGKVNLRTSSGSCWNGEGLLRRGLIVILIEATLIGLKLAPSYYVILGILKNAMEHAGEESGTIIDLWLGGVVPFMFEQAIVIFLLTLFPLSHCGYLAWLKNYNYIQCDMHLRYGRSGVRCGTKESGGCRS
jgi:hypothetical protein